MLDFEAILRETGVSYKALERRSGLHRRTIDKAFKTGKCSRDTAVLIYHGLLDEMQGAYGSSRPMAVNRRGSYVRRARGLPSAVDRDKLRRYYEREFRGFGPEFEKLKAYAFREDLYKLPDFATKKL